MDLETFLQLSVQETAAIVRASGPKTCVFPINGTRRWFFLEHAEKIRNDDPIPAYMDIASQNHIDLYRLFFDHGVDTLLTPEFGPDLLLRGDEYVSRIGVDGLAMLASHPAFVDFYREYGVRIHFYGEYRRYLSGTPYSYLCDLFADITAKTSQNQKHRLFVGVFGADFTQSVAEFSVAYFCEHKVLPSKEQIVAEYYGEHISPVDFFIGFDKFSAFDYPLLATGEEDLYFMVAPSPYLRQEQLRAILFDHLFARRVDEADYQSFSPEDLHWLKEFYRSNRNVVLGTGIIKAGLWLPVSHISLPG